jgi:transcriptional regulator with XRE-family HTH domain
MVVKSRHYGSKMSDRNAGQPNVENLLGTYLRDRRSKLDPAALGFPAERRRTVGLRREEVAQRANISPTWYTCLEQGRGGAPSPEVLDRLARALMLTAVEREHLFLLGLGHAPEAHYRKNEDVTPRLQRILDALDPRPALIRTAIWNVIAWNRAAVIMFGDYGSVPPDQRNALRIIFLEPHIRASQSDWESMARLLVGAFRADVARAGATAEAQPLIAELCQLSPEFCMMWRENDVSGVHTEAVKHMLHPILGPLAFEFSTFAVDGRTDLSMLVYNPTTPEDIHKIRSQMEPR